jgi:hypothetical protein
MLEQQAGIQAKTAAGPRKSSNAGPYVDGDTSNRVRVFGAVHITPGDTRHRRESKPKPQPSHENPAMRVCISMGTPPTEFGFSPLLISPRVTLVTERPAIKDRMMLEQQAGNPSQNRSRATIIQQCGAVCRRGHLQQSSSFIHC